MRPRLSSEPPPQSDSDASRSDSDRGHDVDMEEEHDEGHDGEGGACEVEGETAHPGMCVIVVSYNRICILSHLSCCSRWCW